MELGSVWFWFQLYAYFFPRMTIGLAVQHSFRGYNRDRKEALPRTYNQRHSWYRFLPVAVRLSYVPTYFPVVQPHSLALLHMLVYM